MSLISKFLEFSFPLKILTSAFITSLAGSGLLYFIVEYETYFYVLSKGVRLPFEGVQYLSASVALLGIVIAVCAIIVFLITRFLLILIANQVSRMLSDTVFIYNKSIVELIKEKKPVFKSIELSEVHSKIEAVPFKYILLFLVVVYLALYFVVELVNPEYKVSVRYFWSIIIFVAVLSLWRKSFSWFASTLLVVWVYVTFVITILDFNKYEMFLQAVGYGGGIPIRVQYKGTKEIENFELVIRTKKYLLTSKNKVNEYSEIPIDNIRKITYLQNNELEKYILKILEPYIVKDKIPNENSTNNRANSQK